MSALGAKRRWWPVVSLSADDADFEFSKFSHGLLLLRDVVQRPSRSSGLTVLYEHRSSCCQTQGFGPYLALMDTDSPHSGNEQVTTEREMLPASTGLQHEPFP